MESFRARVHKPSSIVSVLAFLGFTESLCAWMALGVVPSMNYEYYSIRVRIVDASFLLLVAVCASLPFVLAAFWRPARLGIAVGTIIAMLFVNVGFHVAFIRNDHSTAGLLIFTALALSWVIYAVSCSVLDADSAGARQSDSSSPPPRPD